MAHFLYANACSKGEEMIVTTWDMYYEKWGFMLIFWNMAGVPLSYCHCTIYLANHHPDEYRWNRYALAGLYAGYLCNLHSFLFSPKQPILWAQLRKGVANVPHGRQP